MAATTKGLVRVDIVSDTVWYDRVDRCSHDAYVAALQMICGQLLAKRVQDLTICLVTSTVPMLVQPLVLHREKAAGNGY